MLIKQQMAPLKRFAKYSEDLQKVIVLLESGESKDVKKALTIVKRVEKNAAKYAGTSEEVKKPRKLNNYMLFVMENREKVVAQMPPGTKATDVTRKLGEMWQQQKDTWQPKKGTATQVESKKKPAAKKPAASKAKKTKAGFESDEESDS
jgi:cell division septation protein DedD